jgi:hypothetical protein
LCDAKISPVIGTENVGSMPPTGTALWIEVLGLMPEADTTVGRGIFVLVPKADTVLGRGVFVLVLIADIAVGRGVFISVLKTSEAAITGTLTITGEVEAKLAKPSRITEVYCIVRSVDLWRREFSKTEEVRKRIIFQSIV